MKKFLSALNIFLILFSSIWTDRFLAYASFEISTFTIKNVADATYSFNPGDRFSVDIKTSNTLAEAIKQVYVKMSFGNNAGFSYDGIDQRTRIASVGITTPVPSSAYSSSNGLSFEVTNGTTTQVAAGALFDFSRLSNSHTGFVVSPTISTYANILTSWYEAQKTSDSSAVVGAVTSKTLYINVKPHITDYSFSKSSVVGNGSDNVDLTVKVKDYNGCTNIDGGAVTANLANLGLSSTTALTYDSCDADGKTAIFKKVGITTLSSVGDKTFSYTSFAALDENSNSTDQTDANTTFDDEDKKTDIVLTVATPNAPVVTIASTVPSTVSAQNSTVSFSASGTGTYKVVINGDGACAAGTTVTDWTSYDTVGATVNSTIVASSLNDGANTIYACVKNDVSDIGSANTLITKDTTAPAVSAITVNPGNVVTNDPVVSFQCSENGTYKVVMNAFDTGYQTATGGTTLSVTIPNANIAIGANTITLYCRDTAQNEANSTANVSKVALPPSMTASGLTLVDNDVAWDGVDGRDLKVTWDNGVGSTYNGFDSYRIYILPENTAFTGTYIGLVADSGATTWTGLSSTVNDSIGNPLSSGIYSVYIAIMGTSGQIGGTASATGTLTGDVIPHPSVLSASFTATGSLQVRFDTTLHSSTGSHSATGFVYQVGSSAYTGTFVSSVSSDTIHVTIPDLGGTSATGVLSLLTGAVLGTASAGAINYATGGISITDAISPNITNFSTGTTAYYNDFYSGSVSFNYTASEDLAGAGDTKIVFTRVGGNAGTSKTHNITSPASLTGGAHTEVINLASLGLVSGAYYDVNFVTKDLAGNSTTSASIPLKFDNSGPSITSLNAIGPQSILGIANPTFGWFAATDNSGNGSGIKGYKLRVYTGSTTYTAWHSCTGAYTEQNITNLSQLSSTITLANLYNYAWSVLAYDNMENIGTASSCDTFYINTNVPSFSLSSITDTVLSSTSYTKGGNNLVIKSTITNTDSGHIWLGATSIKDSSYANISCATPVSGVTCTYSSSIATYTFSAGASGALSSGVKQVQFTATNIAGINTGTTTISITLDNTAPVIGASTLTAPVGGTIGGTGSTITWVAGNITDNIGISYIKLEYSADGSNWNLISTGANAGTYPWNISALTSGASYQVRISAFDGVGSSATFTGTTFAIDKVAPVVPSSTLTYPSASGVKIKGGTSVSLLWNAGSITDNIGLATNPITLSYSTDGGTNYSLIATNLPNNGSYSWTAPTINNTNLKIKIEAADNVGNISNDVSDNVFEIDSTPPSVTISYAGNGGSTPGTNSFINNSGFDVSAVVSDTNLSGGNLYYSLYNQTANKYYNGTTYTGTIEIWNVIATSTGASYNLASTITSAITNGDFYKFKLRGDDAIGNSTTTSQVTFVGDTINPTLGVTTASGTYFSGSLSIIGTASDTGSTVSSVNIEIKKGGQWWNGSSWVGSQQLLVATTANNYANWSYVFTPAGDNDGQNYTVTAIAHDTAYKTNNSTSSTITVTKDTSGPLISAGVFTTIISGIQKDGNIINITWNTGAITSTGAGVNPNGVILKFNNGAGISTISGATANDGSYSFTLPVGDTQNAFFTIEASDILGNISNLVSSPFFALDSTPPTISTTLTIEDTLGQINGVNIYFSELIAHSSIRLADFSIAGVAGMQTGTISDVGTGTVFVINFTSTGTTGTTPNTTYTAGILTDLSGKALANVTKIPLDTAPPRFTSAGIYDNNGNGKVDQIIVQASEPITANTDTSSWTINAPIAGVAISSVSVAGSTILLNLSEPTLSNTSTGGMTVSFSNNGSWKDSINNLAPIASNINLTDSAPPIATLLQTFDNSGVYAINLAFSEAITGTLSGFTLSGSASFSGSIIQTSLTTLRLITTDSTVTDTAKVYSLSYNGSGTFLKDSSNNYLANSVNTTVSDAIGPKILSRTTLDSNGNGKIDGVRFGFSETLSGSTSGVSISVAGYSVTGYTISGTGITANMTEGTLADTSATPLVQFQNTTLCDITGNVIPSEGGTTLALDTVGPVVTGARFNGVDTVFVSFSENFSGSLSTTKFTLSGATSSILSATGTSGSAQGTITLNGTGIIYGVSEVSFATGSISDSLGNTQSLKSFSKISASAIISEVMWSGTGANSYQYIELQNLSNASLSIAGWKVRNAGPDIVLSGSIAANGYYLIARTDPASSPLNALNVTPDIITGSLLIATGATVQLIDTTSITLDQATVSGNIGDNTLAYSMERRSSPGNGALDASWYTAQTGGNFFDAVGPRGTPKSANVFDATPPIITSSSPADNTLFPLGTTTISYNYSDSGGISTTPVYTFGLAKNNGAGGWSDITATGITSSGITASTASFVTNGLAYGHYRTTFTIQDSAGNPAQQTAYFYVDQFQMTISTLSTNIGVLSTSSQTFSPSVTVTVKTVGAGFSLSLGGSGTMNAGVSELAAWSGAQDKGFGFTSTAGGSGVTSFATLTPISPTTIENIPSGSGNYVGGNGALKTYTYTISYGAKTDSLQAAGTYQSLSNFSIVSQY